MTPPPNDYDPDPHQLCSVALSVVVALVWAGLYHLALMWPS